MKQKKVWLGGGLVIVCLFCLVLTRSYSKKLDGIVLQRANVSFSTTSDKMDKTTTLFGLESKSFEMLLKRISRRGAAARNIQVTGTLLIEQAGTYFFSLNANRSARFLIDREEIIRSNIFERELNQIFPQYLPKGIHSFSLNYTPSSQGAYLQLFWKYSIGGEFHPIPSDIIFSPAAETLSLEELRDTQAKTRSAAFVKHNALIAFFISIIGFFLWILRNALKMDLQPVQVKAPKKSVSQRLTDVDKTKGLAGFFMIMIHLDGANIFPFGVFGAALFFICSGMNTILFIQRSRGKKNYNIYHIFFVLLLFFGGITQIRIAHPNEFRLIPGFLQMSALSILLILILSKFFKNIHHIGFLFPFPFIFYLLYHYGVISRPNVSPELISFLFNFAAFPLFPWSGFFLFGVFLLYFRSSIPKLIGVFLSLAVLSTLSVFVMHIPVDKFRMSLSYILFSLCASAFWFILFHLVSFSRLEQRMRWFFAPLEVIGRNSLMFLYVHYFALAYIPLRSFIHPPLLMLLLSSTIAFLFCSFCVFYYERSKQDMSLFMPALFLFIMLIFLQYGGYLSALVDVKMISILVGVLFAFLYVQLRWKLRILLK